MSAQSSMMHWAKKSEWHISRGIFSKKMASQKSSLRARKATLKHHLSTPYSEKAFKGTYHYILLKSKSVEELGINIHFLCNGSLKVQAWWRKLFVRNNYSVVLGKAKFDCTIFMLVLYEFYCNWSIFLEAINLWAAASIALARYTQFNIKNIAIKAVIYCIEMVISFGLL